MMLGFGLPADNIEPFFAFACVDPEGKEAFTLVDSGRIAVLLHKDAVIDRMAGIPGGAEQGHLDFAVLEAGTVQAAVD